MITAGVDIGSRTSKAVIVDVAVDQGGYREITGAQVIDPQELELDKVRFGTTVVLSDTESGEEVSYTIVGEDESDASQGLISVTSPVARALMQKEVDDEVQVRVPKGTRVFEVLDIRMG